MEQKLKQKRSQIFEDIMHAFSQKYSWLGAQASREMLLSAATWNIEQNVDTPIRYRTHLMFVWKQGWVKSTILRDMSNILGDEFCSTMGKVTDAAIRGSVSGGQFTPPKPLRRPIMVCTELGQSRFDDDLLGRMLALLEEGKTNIALNKIANLEPGEKKKIEENYNEQVKFNENNEYDLEANFVFWGATHDPSVLDDDLVGRFNIVTPPKPLTGDITKNMDKHGSVLSKISKNTVRNLRRELKSTKEPNINFRPPDKFYSEYDLSPRESRDIQSYMAARNWWGLDVNPEIMDDYITFMRNSRRKVNLSPKERIFELLLDNPMSYKEIINQTGLSRYKIYNILHNIDAKMTPTSESNDTKWVIHSGENESFDFKKLKAENKFIPDTKT